MAVQQFSGYNVPQSWGRGVNYQGGQGGQLVRHALVTWRAIRPRNGVPPGTISGQWEQVPNTITSPNQAVTPTPKPTPTPTPAPTPPVSSVTGTAPISVSNNNVSIADFQPSGPDAASGAVPAPPTTAGTTLFLREDATWAPASGGGGGTVTSVGVTAPAELVVTGSPVTSAGVIDLAWDTQAGNKVFASPGSGSGIPAFRSLVIADIPTIPASHTSGFATVATTGAYSDLTGTPTIPTITGSSVLKGASGNAVAANEADVVALWSGTPSGAKFLRDDGVLAVPVAGTGTVTSIALTVPSFLSVAGSPVTTSGTFAVTLAIQSANAVFAGPTSGGAATPTFRALVASDIPSLPYGTGTVTSVSMSVPSFLSVAGSPVTTSGTLAVTLATQNANTIFAGPVTGSAAAPTFRAMVVADMATGYPYANLSGAPTIPTIASTTVLLKGSGTGNAVAAAASDVVAEFSGTPTGAKFLRDDGTLAVPPGTGGSGTVTSVALTVPSFLSVAGSPVTTTGTLAVTLANQSANTLFAGPASGSAAAPTFRTVVAEDLATGTPTAGFANVSAGAGTKPVWQLLSGTAIGFLSGKDRNRPAPAAANFYQATDTGQLYASDGTKWYNTATGIETTTVSSAIGLGGFTNSYYWSGPLIAGTQNNFQPLVNPSSFVMGFYVNSLPGTANTVLFNYGSAATNGFYLSTSTINANKLGLKSIGLNASAVIEFSSMAALTVGVHTFAFMYDGSQIRYCLDGGTVFTVATTGTPTALSGASFMRIGLYTGAGAPPTWMDFGFLLGYSSALSDPNLIAVSGSPSTYRPGVITPDPTYDINNSYFRESEMCATQVNTLRFYGTAAATNRLAYLTPVSSGGAVKTLH